MWMVFSEVQLGVSKTWWEKSNFREKAALRRAGPRAKQPNTRALGLKILGQKKNGLKEILFGYKYIICQINYRIVHN